MQEFLWAREKESHKWHKVPTINGERSLMSFAAKCTKLAKYWTYAKTEAPAPEETCRTCVTL